MVNHQIPLVKGTNPPFACIAEPSVTGLAIAWPPHLTDQTIQSFVPGRTIGSWQRMTKVSVSCSMYEDHALNSLALPMASTSVPCAMMATMLLVDAPGTDLSYIIHRTITAYKPDGWRLALSSTVLTHLFPHLVHDMIYGSPIGNPPPLTYTFTPPNLKSANIDPTYMDNFIKDELDSGHLNGPFSMEEACSMFGGHFHMAPLGLIEKPGSSALRLICHHSKEDDLGQSTNRWMDSSIGATKFYLAANAADFVSLPYTLPYFSPTPIHTIPHIQISHIIYTVSFYDTPL